MSLDQLTLLRGARVEEAVHALCGHVHAGRTETVSLTEAIGRTLAYPFYTPFPMPPFCRAAMDGYAVRADETLSASEASPAVLNVCGRRLPGTGDPLPGAEKPMQAVRIFTGAVMPEGYDTVLMQEAVPNGPSDGTEPEFIKLVRPCRRGEHVALAGEDMEARTLALDEGVVIGAKEVAILASYGSNRIAVRVKPRMAVLPVGDELAVPGLARGNEQIYDANGFMAEARLMELGAEVVRFRPIPDRPQAIEEAIRSAMELADIVITTGGVSVGAHDYAAEAAVRAGGVPLFRKVLMRPGKPTSAFTSRNGLIVCLSGNPSACYAGLELLVAPIVRKASGRLQYDNRIVTGILTEEVAKPCPLTRYVRSSLSFSDGLVKITPLGRDKAGNIAAFAHTDAFAVIPAGSRGASAGSAIQAVLLNRGG
ncbi:gephyrin-like molybdotransferase Glp [Paenibacillus thailandensis]|uniref:Molybdopterin molybdenumtransferase n=1 Tax=Paenibacillus thailandensis TaxID=393250 RepID=A0ABW5R3K6_9BACL